MIAVVASLVGVVWVASTGAALVGGRDVPQWDFRPPLLWLRAVSYISLCWLISLATGTFRRIVEAPPVTSSQLHNPAWWAWTIAAVGVILVGYWVIWARWTLHFDRPKRRAVQLLFGLLWGSGSGQLFVAIHDLFSRTTWPAWVIWLAAWSAIGAWQGVFQDVGWDVWVAPEHDTPWSIKRKVPASHIPNVTVTLTYLALYGNRLLFVGLQALALVAASIFMRFPAWWERRPVLAPATEPAYFGLLRATGFVSDDPDPYATQRQADRALRT